ncbi:type II toxin-antitoxin system RelE/ParE family toxin [Sphingomonas sp. PAMC 26621]|uniref:type II toxin-antitoxin system RelE/ParE family toxin n=1 Tax=Sphingomonas sp. PAMC 26621 TaxID=1112213 RepID=UPI000288C500|nr:type II toxin-antitoxin system RelE/ParE family toxin [Sphingomonas sp. PAMC 26621]
MRRLVYLAGARTAIRDIAVYIAQESGDRAVARRFAQTIRERCRKLAALPGLLGSARPELHRDVRSVAHRGYIIFFRYDPTTLYVVTVLKAERDVERYFVETPPMH